jgi:beta-lactamase class A
MNRLFLACCLSCAVLLGCSSPDVTKLEEGLALMLNSFPGDTGIYVKHLGSGKEIAIRADSLFPTASMIKVPIMLKIFDRIDKGELTYQQELIYKDSLFYSDEDIVGEFRDSASVFLSEAAMLSISNSDNTASLWLQELAGTGVAINQWLHDHGFKGTRMNSRTPLRRGDWEKYGWGQTTPREMARLVEMIRNGEAVSPAASEEMYRVLTRSYWNDEALSQIPPYVQVASKQGAVSASKSEVVLVNAPSGDYLFCIITNNQADTRWEYDNQGAVLIRAVSKLLWDTFEPNQPYTPTEGFDRYNGSN